MSLAIAGSSGGMKGIFVQGVLNAFERGNLVADAYAGSSASALPVISAATRLCSFVGIHYWQRVLDLLNRPGSDLSRVMRQVTREWFREGEPFRQKLFESGDSARLLIAANFVANVQAAAQTQGENARRLGRQLLVQAARKRREWVDGNLQLQLFDTQTQDEQLRLTPDNLSDVSFASTRMIHWALPAWVNGKPYVDASYTCVCPVQEMVDYGYTRVIAIATDPGALYRDIFADQEVPGTLKGVPIHIVRPDMNLKDIGVDYTTCTQAGLIAAFEHGIQKGVEFLTAWSGDS
jgi:predicted acylesterase/phospholipase RssA